MKSKEKRIRQIIREEVMYGYKEKDILDSLEEDIKEEYPEYSVSRDRELLLVDDDKDQRFKIAVKNALDVKPVVEVIYSKLKGGKQTENVRRKIFYLHQKEEFLRYLDGIYF